MRTNSVVVVVDGLTAAELLDLRRLVDDINVLRVGATETHPDAFGSLDAATAAVLLSSLTAATLAAWLLKHRVRKETLRIVVRHPDGTEETREFIVSEEQKADPAVVRAVLDQVTRWLGSFVSAAR